MEKLTQVNSQNWPQELGGRARGYEVKRWVQDTLYLTNFYHFYWEHGFNLMAFRTLARKKFYTQPEVREFWVGNCLCMLAEAAEKDRVYGTGVSLNTPRCYFPSTFTGEDMAGLIRTEILPNFLERGPEDLMPDGQLLQEPYRSQQRNLLRRRMNNAVSGKCLTRRANVSFADYREGNICPPFGDLPQERASLKFV